MAFITLMVLAISVSLSVNGELSDDIVKPCKYGDFECIKATMNSIFKDSSQARASINLPALNPVKFDIIHLQQGEKSPIALDLKLKNTNMYGLDTAKALKVKGFDKDLTKKHSIHVHVDHLSAIGDYDVNGKVLILPIIGSGKANITLVDLDLFLNFVGVPREKDGATYMHVEQLELNADPKKFIFKVDNLFNGDKALGDNMNLFLNENWQEIYNEVRASLMKSFSKVFIDIINNVFSKYPYNKYFTE